MSFADFPEPRPAVELLQRSFERGRLAHAYLFTGNFLDELEAVARTLAKALNCQEPRSRGAFGLALDSCDRCQSCVRIEGGNHPDVQWIRPESKSRVITIDQMRELMQAVHLKATSAEYKVGVIVAADRANVQAANAFLKTLEEPPSKSTLILLTVEPERLLETVLSRCLRLDFARGTERRWGVEQIAWLKAFSESAADGAGGLLNRYRLLGVVQAQLARLKGEIEQALSARSPLERYPEVEPSLREKWELELAAAIEAEYRRQRTDWLAGLQAWLRDVWLAALGFASDMACLPELSQPAQTVARRVSAADAMENLRVWERTQQLLGSNVQEALALEVGLLKLKL